MNFEVDTSSIDYYVANAAAPEVRKAGAFEFINNPIFTDDFSSYATDSGQVMSHRRGFTHPSVYQAINLISGDLGKLDVCLHRRTQGTASEPIIAHPLSRLCNLRPNDEVNPRKFWKRFVTHLLMWGNAYAWIVRDGMGRPEQLISLLPDRTYPLRPDDGELLYMGGISRAPHVIPIDPGDVIHVEGIQDVGIDFAGLDMLQVAKHTWALGLSQEQFMGKFYQRGGRPGGILELAEGTTPKSAKNLSRDFRRIYESPGEAFKTIVLEDGAKFQESQHTFRDTEMTMSQQANALDSGSRFFNIPPSYLGLPDSISYNSRSEDARAYVDNTLTPITRAIEAELSYKLLTRREQSSEFFRFDMSAFLQQDFVSRTNAYAIMVQNGIMTVNEVRARENLPPLEGGDEPHNPTASEPARDTAGDGEE